MSTPEPPTSVSTRGPVLIVGTGLLGTSLALALRAAGVEVQLSDTSPTSLALARDMGAGTLHGKDSPEPRVIVVATPPDVTADDRRLARAASGCRDEDPGNTPQPVVHILSSLSFYRPQETDFSESPFFLSISSQVMKEW